MLIDLKPAITQALRNNSALVLLLGDKKVWPQVAPTEFINSKGIKVPVTTPYVTFSEITNFDNRYASNTAFSSEIHFQIDIWTQSDTGPSAIEVNRTMEELGFTRSGSTDLFETETKTYHKVLRYKTIKYGS
ncbi:hypothetical protein PMSD_18380 [Paenibacillus macquariensis subsp. defensor]|nr:hypothetical protein PMSD_18380 [Paenibacillus macquariensis subsp. defensor]